MTKKYDLKQDLGPIIGGNIPLPNFELMDVHEFANAIASGGHSMLPHWGWARTPTSKQLAQFFLTPAGMGSAQHGSLDGGGLVVIYGHPPIAGRFAICKHEKQEGPGADHRRGWHPGSCRKCGLDMTIDSGD